MSLTGSTGFFSDYYLNLKNANGENFEKEIQKILECKNDFERMAFAESLAFVRENDKELHIKKETESKNMETALVLKEKANMAFKSMKWLEAMVLYTKSYISMPAGPDQAIIIANRSATLYHMEKYDEALIDIKRAIELGYPKNLVYKLYERRARCYLAKKNYPKTIECFKKYITAMDDGNLPNDKRSKMQLEAMTMIKMLEKDPNTKKQDAKLKGLKEEPEITLRIPDEKEFLSNLVRFDQNKEEGRFARAAGDIKVGEEILVENPYVAILLEKFYKTHCENCFVRTVIPVACSKCVDVIYCSEKCLEQAMSKYHKYECGILPTIWRSGASINCHMALRLVVQKPIEYFLQFRDKVEHKLSFKEIRELPLDDYRRVSHLVRHDELRNASNFFQHTLMARFLLKCLQVSGYFDNHESECNYVTIGGFLLRNLQFSQYNTHEVAELHKSTSDGTEKSVFIGGAIYPNLALFNHSCDPSVVRYFRGATIHVNTIKPIEAGLQISENYGVMYTQQAREVRQSKLRELYCFDCCCDACLENWPTFENLPVDVIRFRCDSANKCSAVIEIPPTCNDFMIKCVNCGESTNIFKGLKVMQDTELMTRTAKRFYEAGDYGKALYKFIDLIKIMYEVLAPPFPDFCQCQQNLKDCFLHLGNFYNID